jgi:hypothetical protein
VRASPLAYSASSFLEGAVRVVQVAEDEARDRAVAESEVGGLARAPELGHDAEVDRLALESLEQPTPLLPPLLREADDDRRVAVDERLGGVLALAVPDEDRAFISVPSVSPASGVSSKPG